MTEIQGKSILVRVSARFELARVRVIGGVNCSYTGARYIVSLYWNFATQGLVIPDFAIYCGSLHWNFAI